MRNEFREVLHADAQLAGSSARDYDTSCMQLSAASGVANHSGKRGDLIRYRLFCVCALNLAVMPSAASSFQHAHKTLLQKA
jgi:hypothetical protein